MNLELRQSCTGCGRSLKIRLEEVPEQDFTITCPKCKSEQHVRAQDVAAIASATAVSALPPAAVPAPAPAAPRVPPRSAPAPTDAPDPIGSLGFGAQDLTESLNKRNRVPAHVERDGPSIASSAPKVPPRNAPRTPPRPSLDAPIVAIAGGSALGLVLLSFVIWILWPGGSGSRGATDEIARDTQALTSRYAESGPGGTAPDLFREGLDLFRGDSFADHRDAADRFRRALAAAPHHPEPLAALALNSSFLPRSDRDGIGVAQANVWAAHVQQVLPESMLGGAARATLLGAMGRHPEAKELAQKVVDAHEGSAHAWFVLGHVQRHSDPSSAADAFRKTVELDSTYRIAQTQLAEAELAAGRIRAAAEAVALRDRMGQPSSVSERVAAIVASQLGDETTALDRLTKAVQLEPKDVEARLELGWRLVASGRSADAAVHAKHVLEVSRPAEDATEMQAADASLLLAETQRRSGNAAAAVALAKPIVRIHPNRGAAHYLLGLAQLGAGNADTAAETLREALKAEPAARVQVALGDALVRSGYPEEAVTAYLAAIEKDRGEMLAYAGLAAIYADAEAFTRALDSWEKMLERGTALARFGRAVDPRVPRPPLDLSGHLTRLKRAESVDPNRDSRYRFYEAALLCEAGRVAEGLARVANVRKFEPQHGAYVAGCALAAGRPKEALRLTSRVSTPSQQAVRGWALQAARASGAEQAFRAAMQSDPGEPFARLGLAQSLVARGRREEALALLGPVEQRLGPVPAVLKTRVEAGGP